MESVAVLDMGRHMLRRPLPGLHLVVQVLVPGLEDRARALPPSPAASAPRCWFRAQDFGVWGWRCEQGVVV